MTSRTAAQLAAAGAFAGILAAAAVLHARETAYPTASDRAERLLYLRSGRAADRLMLSFDALAADVYWIRSVQHFGRDRKSGRTTGKYELLYPMLDLTTTLDPRFNIAYRFGAIFLSMKDPVYGGPGRPDQALALLEKGLDRNPGRWQYAFDRGFVYYWTLQDYQSAAREFERAAAIPGAPEWIAQLAAVTKVEGGDRAGARQMLAELERSEQAYIRQTAARSRAQIDTLDRIDQLQALVAAYNTRLGRYPASWNDLIAAGALRGVPDDGVGTPLEYDASQHTVWFNERSPLLPLPKALERSKGSTSR